MAACLPTNTPTAPSLRADGFAAMEANDWPTAEHAWSTLRQAHPDDPAGWVHGAAALEQTGRVAEAEALLTEGMARNPGSPAIVVAMGYQAMQRKDWDTASAYWAEARKLAPTLPDGWVHAAAILLSAGRLEAAEAMMATAAGLMPDNLAVLSKYAYLAVEREDWETALRRWQRVADQCGESPTTNARIAEALGKLTSPPQQAAGTLAAADALAVSSLTITAVPPADSNFVPELVMNSGVRGQPVQHIWSHGPANKELLLQVDSPANNVAAVDQLSSTGWATWVFRGGDNHYPCGQRRRTYEHLALGWGQALNFSFLEISRYDGMRNPLMPPCEFRFQQTGGVDPAGGTSPVYGQYDFLIFTETGPINWLTWGGHIYASMDRVQGRLGLNTTSPVALLDTLGQAVIGRAMAARAEEATGALTIIDPEAKHLRLVRPGHAQIDFRLEGDGGRLDFCDTNADIVPLSVALDGSGRVSAGQLAHGVEIITSRQKLRIGTAGPHQIDPTASVVEIVPDAQTQCAKLVMPPESALADGQVVRLNTTRPLKQFELTTHGGATILGAPVTITPATPLAFYWDGEDGIWHRL